MSNDDGHRDYPQASYSKVTRRGRKPPHPLNDRDDQISLWRVPHSTSNVFTVIGSSNNRFIPLSYSEVSSGRVTRSSRWQPAAPSYPDLPILDNTPQLQNKPTDSNNVKTMGNLFSKIGKNNTNKTVIEHKPEARKPEEPPVKASEMESSARNTKKGWTKVTRKQKKVKNIQNPEKTTVQLHPEPRSKKVFVDVPLRSASLVVPEIDNKSRMKIKRDVRKMRAKVRKQEQRAEAQTKAATEQAKSTTTNGSKSGNECDKHKLPKDKKDGKIQQNKVPVKADEDYLSEKEMETYKNNDEKAVKTSKKKVTFKVDVKEDNPAAPSSGVTASTVPNKIKKVKEPVSIGRGNKPKYYKNKTTKGPSDDTEPILTVNQPGKNKGENTKFMGGKKFKKMFKTKKVRITPVPDTLEIPLALRRLSDKDKIESVPDTRKKSEESKQMYNDESHGVSRKSRSKKVNLNKGKPVEPEKLQVPEKIEVEKSAIVKKRSTNY